MAASGSASNPILLSSDPVSPPPAHRASSPTAVGASTSPTSAYNPSKADVYVDAESSPIPNVQSPDSPSSLAALYGLNAEAGPSGTNAGTKDGPPGTVQAGTAGKQKKQNSDPTSKPKDSALPVLRIILLQVLTSKRSPQLNLTRSFLRKRQLVADDDDPYNLSVYMLKEVICKEWPTGKTACPSACRSC
jgi:hypothetical protein